MAQEAYCNMLVKYREELTRPIDEAMEFLKRVEAQLDSIAGAAGGSSAARLSLAGNEIEKPAGCCNSQLHLLASSRTWSYDGLMFFYYHMCHRLTALGMAVVDSGGGCSGSLPL